MPRKLIPVSKRQHDTVKGLSDGIVAQQQQLNTVASVILMGYDAENIERAGVIGADCTDGVYSLVIEVADIAPAVEPPAKADVA